MSRWRGGQYIDAPHSRNFWFSLTMKAKLQGLFGDARPRTRLPGGVGTTPAPWSGSRAVTAKLQGLFGDARPRNTSRWWGGHYPSAPYSVCRFWRLKAGSGAFSARPRTRLPGGVGTTPAPWSGSRGDQRQRNFGVGKTTKSKRGSGQTSRVPDAPRQAGDGASSLGRFGFDRDPGEAAQRTLSPYPHPGGGVTPGRRPLLPPGGPGGVTSGRGISGSEKATKSKRGSGQTSRVSVAAAGREGASSRAGSRFDRDPGDRSDGEAVLRCHRDFAKANLVDLGFGRFAQNDRVHVPWSIGRVARRARTRPAEGARPLCHKALALWVGCS
ncbi:hypothetical protein G5714_024576 [Onychostoma macrolepis]|uniref:Uncharacterized protein n=1 Tax=Onychostoma macrolepis TaxID=369639 RepID=A0A7J6BKB7_9TELE|nr:hypothetical protein G5714_024576 [Onychostoma macrolepis]